MYANIHDCKIPTELIPHCPKCGRELEPWVRWYHFLEGRKYKDEYENENSISWIRCRSNDTNVYPGTIPRKEGYVVRV